jgi:predicted enzyme related to lactoylglutathione lyase
VQLDHLAIFVADRQRAAEWYMRVLGLEFEFEVPEAGVTAVRDDADLTIFLTERDPAVPTPACILTFRVDDVDVMHEALAGQGVAFREAPQGLSWGYGAELEDPDGHVVCLWDEASMKKHMESSGQGP